MNTHWIALFVAPALVACGSRTYYMMPPPVAPVAFATAPQPTQPPQPVFAGPQLENVVEIVAGTMHTCARLVDGQVVCWGRNDNGELGDGSKTHSDVPTRVVGLTNAVQLSAQSHTCAALQDKGVACWGYNGHGQVGNGSTAEALGAVRVPGVTNAVQAVVGHDHTCVLRTDHTVACWGGNDAGELGNGTLAASLVPVTVPGLSDVAELDARDNHTCARKQDGTVWCWGSNAVGQLGDGRAAHRECTGHLDCSPVPVQVSGLPDAEGLSGTAHVCAQRATGTLVCWGHNESGQLGNGNKTNSNTPVPVMGLANVTQVSAGFSYHTCALTQGGQAHCWGYNALGQLGLGDAEARANPTPVVGMSDVLQIAAGQDHTCALTPQRTVRCWGSNSMGQLGDGHGGNAVFQTSPVPVTALR